MVVTVKNVSDVFNSTVRLTNSWKTFNLTNAEFDIDLYEDDMYRLDMEVLTGGPLDYHLLHGLIIPIFAGEPR